MKINKKTKLFMVTLLIMVSLSVVSATDTNTTQDSSLFEKQSTATNQLTTQTNPSEYKHVTNKTKNTKKVLTKKTNKGTAKQITKVNNSKSLKQADSNHFTDLQNIINQNDNNVLTLDKDYVYDSASDSSLGTGGIAINKNITINGNGHSVNGLNTSRIFYISNGYAVVMGNISLINGVGSALSCNGSTLDVINSTFANNSGNYGGAIQVDNSSLNIINTTFTNNSARINGGAVDNLNSNVTIINSTFTDNNALEYGGVIINPILSNADQTTSSYDCNVVIINSTFVNNTAGINGGVVYGKANLNITNTSFINNSAGNGGVLYNMNNNMNLLNTTFINNSAKVSGSVLYNSNSKIIVINSNFTDNNALEYGGAIINQDYTNITIISSIFRNNKASIYGGSLYDVDANVNIANSTFENNTAYNGGAMYNVKSTITINDTILTDNKVTVNGGALYNLESVVNITDSSFSDNVAGEYGGAILNSGNDINIGNTNFTNNQAKYSGAAIISTKSSMNITHSNFSFNKALVNGGALLDEESIVNITDSIFNNNTASQYGGAVFNRDNSSINVQDTSFTNNQAEYSGAAIISDKSIMNITHSNFSFNKAVGSAGSLYNEESIVNITDSIFNNNTAGQYGGAVFNRDNSSINVQDTSFTNNQASSGGAVYNTLSNLTISNSIFINSTALVNGGVLFNENNNMTIINSTFTNNTSNLGYIVYNGGNLITQNNIFNNNTHDNQDVLFNPTENTTSINNTYNGNYLQAIIIADNQIVEYEDLVCNIGVKLYDVYNSTVTQGIIRLSINGIIQGEMYDQVFNINNGNTTVIIPNNLLDSANNAITLFYIPSNEDYQSHSTVMFVLAKEYDTTINSEIPTDMETNKTYLINITLTDTTNQVPLANQTVMVSTQSMQYNLTTDENGKVTYNYTAYASDNTLNITYTGQNRHKTASQNNTINVSKINTQLIIASDSTVTINHTTPIQIFLIDEKLNKLSNQIIHLTINNTTFSLLTDENGTFKYNYWALNSGEVEIIVKYDGNDTYASTLNTTKIIVNPIKTKITINNTQSAKIGDLIQITIKLTDEDNRNLVDSGVVLTIDDVYTRLITDSTGSATFNYEAKTTGIKQIIASLYGNAVYEGYNTTSTVTINKINTQLTVTVDQTSKIGQTSQIIIKLVDEYNNPIEGNIDLTINNNTQTIIINNTGVETIDYTSTIEGINIIEAIYAGDSYYNMSNASAKIDVASLTNTTINLESISGAIGENITVTAIIKDVDGNAVHEGQVIFTVNDVIIGSSNVINGTANMVLTLNKKYNNTQIMAAYIDENNNYASSYNTTIMMVSLRKPTVALATSSINSKLDDDVTFTAIITDNGKLVTQGYVAFKLNGVTLLNSSGQRNLIKVVNGTAQFTYHIPADYKGGDYNITVVYAGSDYERAEDYGNLFVRKLNTHMQANVIETSSNNTATLNVKIFDENNNILKRNVVISIKVNGITMLQEVTLQKGGSNYSLTLKPRATPYNITVITGENSGYIDSNITLIYHNPLASLTSIPKTNTSNQTIK